MDRAIGDNIIAGSLDRYRTRWGTLNNSKTRTTIRELFDRLRIKAPRVTAPVRSLSGGNAQRVVLAKWLAIWPRVLILNGPTVGVDVGSKEEILEDSARGGRGRPLRSSSSPTTSPSSSRRATGRQWSGGAGYLTLMESDDINVSLILETMAA